jgi:peptide chain release factor 1
VTDHRIGMSLSNLDLVLEGEGLMPLVDGLRLDHERAIMDELLED